MVRCVKANVIMLSELRELVKLMLPFILILVCVLASFIFYDLRGKE